MDLRCKIIWAFCLSIFLLTAMASGYGGDFINPDANSVTIPPYTGERYERLVPDTLDIAERSRLAIEGLTGPMDPEDYYSHYWLVNFQNTPPMMSKEQYINLGAKFREALPLMRIITGDNKNSNVDQVWMDTLLKDIGPDGLIYQRQGAQIPRYSLAGCGLGRLMGAMMIYYQRDGDKQWLDRVKAIVDRYNELAVDKGDWAYFCISNIAQGYEESGECDPPVGIWAVDGTMGRIIQPLGQYFKLTGYPVAKELGDKLINYLIKQSNFFGPNGEWLTDKLDPNLYPNREEDVHFGTHSHTLLYMLDYAICTNNQDLKKYCEKSFNWAKHRNSTIEGQSETATKIGFFIEYLNPYYPTSEICCIADMLAVALKLSEAGVGDYWDDADSWIRNHFFESQIQFADWTNRLKHPHWPRVPQKGVETNDNVAQRNVGCFLSWVTANDGCQSRIMEGDQMHVAPGVSIGIMHCCTGNATRTMYYAWDNILSWNDGELKVNLLLNRASKWADIDSYIPYTGRVDIIVKENIKKLSVRVPEWISSKSNKVVFRIGDDKKAFKWQGRYMSMGSVKAGDIVKIEFPIEETVVNRRVYGVPSPTVIGGYGYERLIFRGNTLVNIDPAGKNYPLYQRQYYRSEEPRYRKVKRFISDQQVSW